MPPTSEQLPLISIYYVLCIITVACSTTMSVITLHINNKGSRGCQFPGFLKLVLFKCIAKLLLIKLNSYQTLKFVDKSSVEIDAISEPYK